MNYLRDLSTFLMEGKYYSQDGKNELLYMTAVELYSKDAEIYHTANQLSGIEGIGEMLPLTFYFNKQELKPGKYTIENIYAFDEVLKDGLVTKSYNLGVGIGFDFRDNGTGDFYNRREGDISIRKSGNEYTVEVDVLTTNSKRVKAKYTGHYLCSGIRSPADCSQEQNVS